MSIIERILTSETLKVAIGKVGLAILFIFVASLLINLLIKSLEKILYRGTNQKKKRTLFAVLSNLIKVIVYFVTVMIILELFGVDTTSIVAVAGVGSVALGFGAQKLVEDMISGLFILVEDQYDIGDYIEIAGYSGDVEKLSLRTTILRKASGEQCVVPNGEIRGVTNYNREFINAVVELPIPYEVDLDKTLQLIKSISDKYFVVGKTLEAPKVLGVNEFGDSAIEVLILCKSLPGEKWNIERDLRKTLLEELMKEGIEIPYNTSTIHVASTPNEKVDTH